MKATNLNSIIRLLWIKIIGTGLGAALPVLLVPASVYLWLGFPPQATMVFLRLYGLSTIALLVGYYGGIEQVRRGEFPAGVLRMGLVSNGGQGLLMAAAGLAGTYSAWGWMAQTMMWFLCVFVLGIASMIVLFLNNRTYGK
jgi:hypothetical protein